jgi:hypothetical protein
MSRKQNAARPGRRSGVPDFSFADSKNGSEHNLTPGAPQGRTKWVGVPNYRDGIVEWREVPADAEPTGVVGR